MRVYIVYPDLLDQMVFSPNCDEQITLVEGFEIYSVQPMGENALLVTTVAVSSPVAPPQPQGAPL